ncbi:MAG: LptF/LptG family permease, partial [Deltaproteobacteria bacterium]
MTSGQQDIAGHLDRHLTTELGRLFAATLGGVVLIYLVIDFADRAHGFHGRAWGKSVLELYANKAAVVSYQLAPAALIIAAALLVTLLSRRGELIALYGLGVRPLRLAL